MTALRDEQVTSRFMFSIIRHRCVIKNKTKKNNDPTWDNRTWDKKTGQCTCIDRFKPYINQRAAARWCWKNMLSRNSKVTFWYSAKKATICIWLNRFWLRCSGDYMRLKKISDSWYSTNKHFVSWRCTSNVVQIKADVTASRATNGERNTLNRLLDLPITAKQVRKLQNYQLCVYFSVI